MPNLRFAAPKERRAAIVTGGARGAVPGIGERHGTDRDWGEAGGQLADRQIPVHTIAASTPPGDLYPVGIRALPPVRAGQTAKIIVDVVGEAPKMDVTLSSGDKILARQVTQCSGRASIELELEPSDAGRPEARRVGTEVRSRWSPYH